VSVPSAKNWLDLGAVTPVKNQEQCGSCWAFSATEEIESMWILAGKATNTTVNLAPQQIVDCDTTSAGCGGGETGSAYNYVISAGGQEPEKDYPYTAQNGPCTSKTSDFVAKISSWKMATSDYDEKTLQANLVSWGPISICVDASHWQDYQSGVMTWEQCAWINILDHCVQLTGYNLHPSPYWIVRNSWGASWGQSGYIWLEMWEDTCGIAHDATSVTI
jgi:cathepsin F